VDYVPEAPAAPAVSGEVEDARELRNMADQELMSPRLKGASRLDAKTAKAEAEARLEVLSEVVSRRQAGTDDAAILRGFVEDLESDEARMAGGKARSAHTPDATLRTEARYSVLDEYVNAGELPDAEALARQRDVIQQARFETLPSETAGAARAATPKGRLRALQSQLDDLGRGRQTKAKRAERGRLMGEMGKLQDEIDVTEQGRRGLIPEPQAAPGDLFEQAKPLRTVADDAERAAEAGEELPIAFPETPEVTRIRQTAATRATGDLQQVDDDTLMKAWRAAQKECELG
jgi:polyhydroxyalkanoate synthesis regulator phasin